MSIALGTVQVNKILPSHDAGRMFQFFVLQAAEGLRQG
jgi:hypothetical protein